MFQSKYDGLVFDEGLRLDVLVEDEIICELKAVDEVNKIWEAQILSHLKLLDKRLGYLINFNVKTLVEALGALSYKSLIFKTQ